MQQEAFNQAMQDVARHFQTPRAVIESGELDRQQKIKLLQQWEQDLRLEMVATEENMPGKMSTQNKGGAAEKFRDVRAALADLGVKSDDKPAGVSKSGG
jgi:hypothetical protein